MNECDQSFAPQKPNKSISSSNVRVNIQQVQIRTRKGHFDKGFSNGNIEVLSMLQGMMTSVILPALATGIRKIAIYS